MKRALLLAARLPADAPHAPLLCGRALCPDGLELLQAPPLGLSRYTAARVRHALASAPGVNDAETLCSAAAYVATGECSFPASLAPLANLCARGGCAKPRGVALGLLWARSVDDAVRNAFPRPPHPFLMAALRDEVARARRAVLRPTLQRRDASKEH